MEMIGQLHASAVLFPGKSLGTHWLGGCVGPIAYLGGEEKNLLLLSGFKPRTIQPVS
jgi:hypothetical protein